MSNTLLTPTMIMNEALAVLHDKLNFVGNCNRQYDDRFARTGAKIGDTLQIRLPTEYTVRTGRVMDTNDTVEKKVDLQVASMKGVDLKFTSQELTLDINSFSELVIEPAMTRLASSIEAEVIEYAVLNTPNEISDLDISTKFNKQLNRVRVRMDHNLCPSERAGILNGGDQVNLSDEIGSQYLPTKNVNMANLEGYVGRLNGFELFENNMMYTHTTGTDDGTGNHKVNGANQSGTSITHNSAGSGTLKQGDIITFAGCYAVHQETKAVRSYLKQFVVTEDMSATDTTVSIYPEMITSGPFQNVSASPTNGGAIYKRESDDTTAVGSGASYTPAICMNKKALAFVTADLEMPQNKWGTRKKMDGISARMVKDYNINDDTMPCRFDVLYGYKLVRPEFICRFAANPD